MEKVQFTDPLSGEVLTFRVEEQTTLNGCNYLLVSDDEDNACILKEIAGNEEDEEVSYEFVEDDVEFDALARIFTELMDDTDIDYQ